VQKALPKFRAAGAQAIAIGQGTGAEAAEVARELGLEFPVYGDPKRSNYRKLGLPRASLFGISLAPLLEAPLEGLRTLREASLRWSASPRSDVRQLAGALVVDRDGTVRYFHRSEKPTDVPPAEELLEVVEGLRPAAN